jgi:hypothetical protein
MTREDGTKELDRLFSRISESPWRNRDRNTVPTQLGGGGGSTVAEQMGYSNIYDAMESGGGGLVNGDFSSGPPEDAADIDATENDLPGWTFVEVQGTWQVSWDESAGGISGYRITATQGSAAASDEFYFEQIIPSPTYRRLVTTAIHSADNSNMGFKIAVAFLDDEGNVIGSELSNTWSVTSEQTSRFWREPPEDAFEVRIRVGYVNAAGTAGQLGRFTLISIEEPTVYSVNIPGVKSTFSPAASTDYALPYPSDVIPNGVYKADTPGFVLGVSVKTDDTIAAGTLTARVENDTQATTPGATAALSSGVTAASGTFSLDGVADYHFAAGDELHLELSGDGSVSTTGSADYYGSARLLLVVNDEGDW